MANCSHDGQLGFKRKAWIFNYEEVVKEASESEKVSWTLKNSARGYMLEQISKNPFEGTNSALVVGTYRNSFTHQVKLHVPDTAEVAPVMNEIASGKFIVCLDNGEGGIRVYGYYNGLKATEITNDPTSEDTDGGWVVTLEETKAKTCRLVFNGDADELDALCQATA